MSIDDVLRRILTAPSPDEAVRMAWGVVRYAEAVGVQCDDVRDTPASAVGAEDVAAHGMPRAHAATVARRALDRLGWRRWPGDMEAVLAWGVGGRAVPRSRPPETTAERERRIDRARFAGSWRLAAKAALRIARDLGGRLGEVAAAAIEGRRLDGFGGDGCPSAADIVESARIHRARFGGSAELDALAGYANARVGLASLPTGYRDFVLFQCAGLAHREVEAAEAAAVAESDGHELQRVTLLPAWETTEQRETTFAERESR